MYYDFMKSRVLLGDSEEVITVHNLCFLGHKTEEGVSITSNVLTYHKRESKLTNI